MTTRDKYTEVPDPYSWEVPSTGDARFIWEYDEGAPGCFRCTPRTLSQRKEP